MKKIKYQGGITKLIASKIAGKNKKKFATYIDQNLSSLVKELGNKFIQVDLVSFSSKKDFYEQVLSILSFFRYVGSPNSWIIYSDGSHTRKQINILESGFEFVKVKLWDWDNASKLPDNTKDVLLPYKNILFDYAKKMPLGRKLYYYLNHSVNMPTIFLDSDILFYQKSSILKIVLDEKVDGWYMLDPSWGCLDSRYKQKNSEQPYQLNGGFVIVNKELPNLIDGLEFLKSLNREYEYFTDQTIFHILSRCNDFRPLDPRIFIISTEDQFDFNYINKTDNIAVRHYTGPVRHKMWQKDWRWQLSII